ncbi:MAG: efflux RND transporter periplasmic adaptor subunit [Rubrivivax sp.]|nr:MAG: efflux RND transporter periplasmic adaptor subunit [Rubrivivax sp.]
MIDSSDFRVTTHARALAWTGLAIASLAALTACSPAPEKAPPVPAVYVTPVRNDHGQDVRILSGTVRPRIESDLAFRAGGKVTARLVDIGQAVRVGQPLARIDAADYQLAADAAAEQLRAAQVDATQAASDAARFKRLLADGSVGAADHERQQARSDAAAARLVQAERQLEVLRNRAGYAVLAAPFDGVVTGLQVEVGQMVAEGQPVMMLAKPGELEIVVDVPEALAPGLREQVAQARIAGVPAPVTLGLRELAPSASAQTRTFRARYAIASPPPGLRMGVTADVQLARKGAAASAELPSGALLTTDQNPSVWLVNDKAGTLTRRPVTLQSQSTDRVRVTGLPDGALVVSAGAQKLDASMKVQAVMRPGSL